MKKNFQPIPQLNVQHITINSGTYLCVESCLPNECKIRAIEIRRSIVGIAIEILKDAFPHEIKTEEKKSGRIG